ncbi:aquaporin family protein [Paraburkholderia sediminicola]|uniref:MIP/aquaporin family protein n=1 Tax=Paraburkholderia sediminicola TaxID=458836 RepID=UPI0038BC29E9
MRLRHAVVAEFLGTAMLLATVVGSGIMGERLAGGNVAIALLANTLATGAGLVALIATFIHISGAHFNPLVTLAEVGLGKLRWKHAGAYIVAQVAGAIGGVIAAHGMFDLPLIETSHHVRTGLSQWWSEVVASFGLLTVILQVAKRRIEFIPAAVGAYITAAYWFTASTSFANPAVTVARSLTDTFSGIRPVDAPGFIVSQLVGATLAVLVFRWMEQSHDSAGSAPKAVGQKDAKADAERLRAVSAEQIDETEIPGARRR